MSEPLYIYNTLTAKKEIFTPLHAPKVGFYVCGPTVYNYVHLGNCRTFVVFDVMRRYLTHLGYQVRFVRNITDVGHLENDADEGEDKISKKARLEALEPMEIVQNYTLYFHEVLQKLNTLPPSIEPTATGHLIEQIQLIEKILQAGYAYEHNGSVYFDVHKYHQNYPYGELSGRKIEELQEVSRTLKSTSDKKNAADFALWKKASSAHIMRWPSPWSEGFPGWHIECSAMSTKYLGEHFDIHGGGMDLKFPHHECEIAQAMAAHQKQPARYWLHSNMLTVNGQKMSKSANNFLTPDQVFSGNSFLEKAYSPMVLRLFILQAHYRSILDFSKEALDAAQVVYQKINRAFEQFSNMATAQDAAPSPELPALLSKCDAAMKDDFNTALLLTHLQELVRWMNQKVDQKQEIAVQDKTTVLLHWQHFFINILGLQLETKTVHTKNTDFSEVLIALRDKAKKEKNFVLADEIRSALHAKGWALRDTPEGTKLDAL